MEVGEARALGMEAVKVRRLQIGVPRAGEIAHALVVGEDEHDVRPTARKRLGFGGEAQTCCGEKEDDGEFHERSA